MMPRLFRVKKIIRETPKAVTLFFEGKIDYKPGQFIMLWYPGVDEKPFALSYHDKNEFAATIEQKGEFTKKIAGINPGKLLGVRGPFGHGFTLNDNSIIVVGGLGMAPALSLINRVKNSLIIQAARSKKHLLYLNDEKVIDAIKRNKNKIIYCTDDGSFGLKMLAPEALKSVISSKVKKVYTCGPELMMLKVFEICMKRNVECEASLERFMKCGIGICGSCCIGDQLVCKDGPVFNSAMIRKLKELGKFARLGSGKRVSLKDYYTLSMDRRIRE